MGISLTGTAYNYLGLAGVADPGANPAKTSHISTDGTAALCGYLLSKSRASRYADFCHGCVQANGGKP